MRREHHHEPDYTGAIYLHVNGELIHKRMLPGLINDLQESDFVTHYWLIDPHDRRTLWRVLIEGAAMGAERARVNALATLWYCSNDDAQEYARLSGIDLVQHGGQYLAVIDGLTGRGNRALDALISLYKQQR